jgi:hypothetical protein
MADQEQTQESGTAEETNGTNRSGDSTRKTVARAAVVAAATGATALAARKVLDRGNGGKAEGERKPSSNDKGGGGNASVMTSMVSSAWDSARDSLVPMIEDAAEHAGAYVAQNTPDIVRETVVPNFIRGFERAQKSSQDDKE